MFFEVLLHLLSYDIWVNSEWVNRNCCIKFHNMHRSDVFKFPFGTRAISLLFPFFFIKFSVTPLIIAGLLVRLRPSA